jgi:hypothetical protein
VHDDTVGAAHGVLGQRVGDDLQRRHHLAFGDRRARRQDRQRHARQGVERFQAAAVDAQHAAHAGVEVDPPGARRRAPQPGAGGGCGDALGGGVLFDVAVFQAGDVDRPPADDGELVDVGGSERLALAQHPPSGLVVDVVAEDRPPRLVQWHPLELHRRHDLPSRPVRQRLG